MNPSIISRTSSLKTGSSTDAYYYNKHTVVHYTQIFTQLCHCDVIGIRHALMKHPCGLAIKVFEAVLVLGSLTDKVIRTVAVNVHVNSKFH